LGSVLFFLVAPGVVAGVVPWSITRYADLVDALAVAVVLFVAAYEQPTLRSTYGPLYDAYCRAVLAWWPRLTPWDGASGSSVADSDCWQEIRVDRLWIHGRPAGLTARQGDAAATLEFE
jgi:hypothetical protein